MCSNGCTATTTCANYQDVHCSWFKTFQHLRSMLASQRHHVRLVATSAISTRDQINALSWNLFVFQVRIRRIEEANVCSCCTVLCTDVEASAATVEEAVEKGLAEIGAAREDVNIEVLDEGKRNLFRFASRQARVRLTLREPGSAPARPVKPAQERPITVVKPEIEQSTVPTSEMVSGYEEQQAIVAETTLEILKNMGISAAAFAPPPCG